METRLPQSQANAVQRCFARKDPDDQFCTLAEVLLWRNQALAALLCDLDGPGGGANASQQVFAAVATLDLHMQNGGLFQFYWNCPGWIEIVPASLRELSLLDLAGAFEESTA